jgi:phosphohistidine phosphatase SixA
MLFRITLFLALLFLVVSTTLAADFPITVYLVRHAERADTPANDPILSPVGTARANKLAGLLSGKKVTAVYTSEFARTRLTGKPLADQMHIAVNDRISGGKTQELAQAILNGKDRAVLVVGHSNTVPSVIAALGAGNVPPIPETEFDNFYVVTVTGPGKATVTHSKY